MFSKASVNIVTDANLAYQCSQVSKVLYIGELNQNIPQQFIPCSVLLPPFDALNAEINGDMQLYERIYSSHLAINKNCFDMFATILVALYNGINITLYIENGDDLSHKAFLQKYILNTYGILCGTQANQYQYDIRFDAQNATIIYTYMDGFISTNEYLNAIPSIEVLIEMQKVPACDPISKIIYENKLVGNQNDVLRWISSYIDRLHMVLIPGDLIKFNE